MSGGDQEQDLAHHPPRRSDLTRRPGDRGGLSESDLRHPDTRSPQPNAISSRPTAPAPAVEGRVAEGAEGATIAPRPSGARLRRQRSGAASRRRPSRRRPSPLRLARPWPRVPRRPRAAGEACRVAFALAQGQLRVRELASSKKVVSPVGRARRGTPGRRSRRRAGRRRRRGDSASLLNLRGRPRPRCGSGPGGTILAAAGTTVAVSRAIIGTTHGAFIVTQECIVIPLIPLYVAAALAAPMGGGRRPRCMAATPVVWRFTTAERRGPV